MSNPCKDHRKPSRAAWLILALAAGLFLCQSAFAITVRVPEAQARKSIVQKVRPAYPVLARQMRLSGHVVLDIYVGTSGKVEKANVVSGNPILGNAAVAAAKKWRFQPFQAGGKATEAVVRIGFDFNN
ncbi:MAG TPA: energy transducer TonB [Bryobacteraceae bacterium]